MVQMKKETPNIGNTKLVSMPLLPILCFCENIAWTRFQFIQSGRNLIHLSLIVYLNNCQIPTWSISQILPMK